MGEGSALPPSSNGYHYYPLEESEIRVVTVERVTDTEVFCSMAHMKLLAHTKHRSRYLYCPLSYTWGVAAPSAQPRHIILDNVPVPVTENLWQALRGLGGVKARVLKTYWVDALCINQNDVEERNKQVQRMADIYSCSMKTHVWLGEASEDFHIIHRCIMHLNMLYLSKYAFKVMTFQNINVFASPIPADFQREEPFLDRFFQHWQSRYDKENALWPALTRFLKRTYFRRVWVIQEVVVSVFCRVIVGDTKISGRLFVAAMNTIQAYTASRPHLLPDPEAQAALRTIHFISQTAARYQNTYPWYPYDRLRKRLLSQEKVQSVANRLRFEVLLGNTLASNATDPRDYVFGLVSVSSYDGKKPFQADYRLKTPEEVYTKATHYCIETLKSPLILSLAGTQIHGQEWSKALPTWIPDLNQRSTGAVPPQSMVHDGRLQCAVHLPFDGRILDSKTLTVSAALLTSIVEVVPPPEGGPEGLRAWFSACESLEAKYQDVCLDDAKSFPISLWKTMVWDDVLAEGYSSSAASQLVLEDAAPDRATASTRAIRAGYEIRRIFQSIGYGRRKAIMMTESGRVVSGPIATLPGDQVCVIAGGTVPFVMRPLTEHEGYRVVGECYVSGIMNGELKELKDLEFNSIKLR